MFYFVDRWRPLLPTLACLIAFAVGLPSLGIAQRPSGSQRVLPLPASGPSDLPTQFRLMQELQRLMQSKHADEAHPNGHEGDSPYDLLEQWKKDLSPQQLEAMEDLVKQFPGLAQSFKNSNATDQHSPQQLSHVQRLLEQYQKTGRLPPQSPDSRSQSKPGLLPPSLPMQGSPTQNSPRQNSANTGDPNTGDPASLQDLMRRATDDPKSLPPLSVPPYLRKENEKSTKEPSRANFAGRDVPSNNGPERSASRANNSSRAEIQQKLNTKGLEGTWRELVQQAQRDAKTQPQQAPAAPANGESNWFDLDAKVLQSLDGAKDELLKIAQDTASSNRPRPTPAAPPPPPPNPNANFGSRPPRPEAGTGKNGFPGESFLKSVGDAFRSATDATSEGEVASSSGMGEFGESSLASSLEWLLLAGLVGVAMFFWLRRSRPGDARSSLESTISPTVNIDVNDRADIVRAFHQMVATAKIPTENWWPHRRAASALVEFNPELASPAQVLSRLYELARYLPADQHLSESQIQDARRAVEQLRAC